MLSNQKVKYIKSLQIKKYRSKHSSFLVEGAKNVLEVLRSSYKIETLIVSEKFEETHQSLFDYSESEILVQKEAKIASLGHLKTNDSAIAVVTMPPKAEFVLEREIILLLDDISDPGNLGTIIRTADWYGIKKIVASKETVDVYNPKVVQASMGSFTRVNLFYEQLSEFIKSYPEIRKMGATLNGQSVQEVKINMPLAIVFGNESNGIRQELLDVLDDHITIPRYGQAESLNVAMSVAIICDNIRRIESKLKK